MRIAIEEAAVYCASIKAQNKINLILTFRLHEVFNFYPQATAGVVWDDHKHFHSTPKCKVVISTPMKTIQQ